MAHFPNHRSPGSAAGHGRVRADRRDGAMSRLGAAQEGAAYVEFLIGFFPILILFVGLLQLQVVYVTRLFVARAAFAGARAAAVFIPQPSPDDGIIRHEPSEDALDAINEAVLIAAGPVMARGWLAGMPISYFPASNEPSSQEEVTDFTDRGMVRLRVFAHYVCHMPPLDLLMCEKRENQRVIFMSADAVFPYQRADYKLDLEHEDDKPTDKGGRHPFQ